MGRQAVPPPPGGGYTGVQTSHRSGRPLLVPVKTMAWIRRKAEKIACRTTVRMLKLVRKGHTNRPHTHLDRPRGQAGLQAHPVTVMAVASTAGTASTQSYVIIRHHVQPHASRDQRRGYGRPAQADPHAHQPPSGNSQKTAKPAILHPAGHAPRPMPRRSPRASDPHTGHIPIPPQSDHVHAETSAAGSANQASAGLLKLPATATTCSPPAASTHDVASRRDVGVADARGAALRLQARLGADRYSMPWGMLLRYLRPSCGRATALGEGDWSKISDLGA